jgi:DNA-binding CsgD family transcriptional regulator
MITLQAVSALFFLGDVMADFSAIGFDPHTTYEAVATLALLLGVGFGGIEMTRMVRYNSRAETALKMASGAFSEVLSDRFSAWKLTPSEAEVALLTLKGFGGPQIADLRGTAPGTVRAQLGHIYAKSGCNGRGQFVSLFIDALLDDQIGPSWQTS